MPNHTILFIRSRSLALGFLGLATVVSVSVQDALASSFLAGVSIPSAGSNCVVPLVGSSASDTLVDSGSFGFSDTIAAAAAAAGSLTGHMRASATGTSTNFDFSASGCFHAEMIIDDIVIDGPGSQVATTVSADLSGAISGSNSTSGTRGLGSTTARVEATGGGSSVFSTGTVSFGFPGDPLAGVELFADTLTTSSFNAPVGQPFSVTMTLVGGGDVTAGFDQFEQRDGTAVIGNDFGSTLKFTTLGPVFDLPPGYTVNSADGGIVDNQYVVPEPTTGTLLGLVLVLLGRRPRRAQRGLLLLEVQPERSSSRAL